MTCAMSAACDVTIFEYSVGFLCSNPDSAGIHMQHGVHASV